MILIWTQILLLGNFFTMVTCPGGDCTNPHQTSLERGNSLGPYEGVFSPSGNSVLCMQWDGNLVLYRNNHVCWASYTVGGPSRLIFQRSDGNLFMLDNCTRSRVKHDFGIGRRGGAKITVSDNCRFNLYDCFDYLLSSFP